MNIFRHIDKRLLFFFLIIAIIPLGIATFLVHNNSVKALKHQTFDQLELTAGNLKNYINMFIECHKNIARDFASEKLVIQALKRLSHLDPDYLMILEELNQHMVLHKMPLYSPNLLGISILNNKGKVIFSIDETELGRDESDKDYFVMAKKWGYCGDLHYSAIFHEPVIEVSAPVIDKETGDLMGVVVNTISGTTLANITQINWFGNYGNVGSQEAISSGFYAPAAERSIKDLQSTYQAPAISGEIYIVNKNKEILSSSRFVVDPALKQLADTEPVQKALETGDEMVGIYPNYMNMPVIGASIFIDELKWVILAEIDLATAFSPIFRLKAQIITIWIITIGLIVAISSLVSKRLTRPISLLLEGTKRLSEGKLDYRIKEIPSDEFGELASSFNKMCNDIQTMCDNIQKVTISKDSLENILKGMSESIIITDLDYKIKSVNLTTLTMLGYGEFELINHSIFTIVEGELPHFTPKVIDELIASGRPIISPDIIYKTKDGMKVPISLSASLIRTCKHRKHIHDCTLYIKRKTCAGCKVLNIAFIGSDMREIMSLIQRERGWIYELTKELGYTMRYNDLFRLILSSLHKAIKFDIAGSILCYSPGDVINIRSRQVLDKRLIDIYQEHLLESFARLSLTDHKGCRKEFFVLSDEAVSPHPPQSADTGHEHEIDHTEINEGDETILKIFRSQFSVPLVVDGRIIGMVNVASFKNNAFTEVNIRMLETVMRQTSLSIQQLKAFVEKEKEKLTSILRDMIDGVVIIDTNGIINMINPAGKEILKYLSSCKEGDVLTQLGGYSLKEPFELILNGKKEYILEELTINKEGFDEVVFSITISSIKGERQYIGMAIVIRDISKERRMHQQLLHAEKLSSIGKMVAGIAHEINNPLAGVMGLSQLILLQPNLPENIRENVNKIYTYSDRSKRIIENLLTFARLHKPTKAPVDINASIEQTFGMLSYNIKNSGIEVVKNMEIGLPHVVCDMYQIQQVFFNIINNAYQALLEYNGNRVLTIVTKRNGERLEISFHNTGPGISQEIIKKMFDPFFTTKEVGKGTGLGLSVSHGIIKEHGGSIYATSKKGNGVTIYIELPLYTEVQTEDDYGTLQDKNIMPTLTTPKVLIVDDEKVVVDTLSSLLQTEGYVCDIAMDGKEAIEKLTNGTKGYGLIIADIRMPNLDGKEFYSYLKLNDPDIANRFIAITGDILNPDTVSFLRDNNIPHIVKPFTLKDIKDAIGEALYGRPWKGQPLQQLPL